MAPPGKTIGWMVLGWVLGVAAFANAGAYIAHAANPLVASDAWYFIEAFLRPAMEEGAGLADFFVKRSGFDHAQPFGKLLLLLNARWFGLDFVVEAMIGLLFAALTFLVCAVAVQRGAAHQSAPTRALGLAAIAATLVTLNCGMVFDWSLVTLSYAPYFVAVAAGVAAWSVMRGSRIHLLALLTLAAAFGFDDVGLIINVVLAAVAALAGLSTGLRKRAGLVIAVAIGSELAYMVFAQLLLNQPVVAAGGPGAADQLQAFWAMRGDFPAAARIVLGSTLAHHFQLVHYFGARAVPVQWALACAVLLAHLWFWWRAWRGGWNHAVFLAVLIMLLLYAFVAGIAYARFTTFGVNYFHQPRYMVFYLLGNVALVLMLVGQPSASGGAPRVAAAARYLVLGALLALQIPLSAYTWGQARYLGGYYHGMARQMLALGGGEVPAQCTPQLTVCSRPEQEREEVMHFLASRRLNLYSPAFISRYRLEALTNGLEPSERAPAR